MILQIDVDDTIAKKLEDISMSVGISREKWIADILTVAVVSMATQPEEMKRVADLMGSSAPGQLLITKLKKHKE